MLYGNACRPPSVPPFPADNTGMNIRTSLQTLLLLTAVGGALLAAAPRADAQQVFRADWHTAQWHAFEGRSGCHLVHEVPGKGVALLSHRADRRQIISFFASHPPREELRGDLYIANAQWGAERRDHVEPVRVHPDDRTLRFSQRTTHRIVDALRNGRQPLIRYNNWYSDDAVEVGLTPAMFTAAYRNYLECIDRRDRIDVATATRGAVIPGSYGDPMADADADTERRQPRLPRLPAGPRQDIYFATGSSGLTLDSMERIQEFARDLDENPHWGIVLTIGYADTRGDETLNEELARRRAERVRDELVRMGIPQSRIEVETRVLTQDAFLEAGPEELARNRRVELRTAL